MMKNVFKLSVLTVMLMITVAGCKNDKEKVTDTMEKIDLKGCVYDIYGKPISGARVSTGELSVQTNSDGEFTFDKALIVNNRAVIKFEKSGFFTLTRSGVKDDEMYIEAVLSQKGNSDISISTTFDASDGKILEVPAGMKVVLPAGSFKRADGSAYNGKVKADMLYLDPNNENFSALMPGGDLAAIRENNSETMLISWGMTNVCLEDENGNPLQLNGKLPSELTFPIPDNMKTNPPSKIELWHFDEDKGIWLETGIAELVGDEYKGSVTHFSWVNLDEPTERVTITGFLTDCNNKPVPHVKVTADQYSAFSASTGKYTMYVPANTSITVGVKSRDYFNYFPEKKYEIPPKQGGSVVTQDFSLPCFDIIQEELPEKLSVKYSIVDGYDLVYYMTFDNYGKRFRMDVYSVNEEHHVTLIIDEILEKMIYYHFFEPDNYNPSNWVEKDINDYAGDESAGIESGSMEDFTSLNDEQMAYNNYIRRPNEMIGGQSCDIFEKTDHNGTYNKRARWKMINMLIVYDDRIRMKAEDTTFNVPEEAFTKTLDITWWRRN